MVRRKEWQRLPSLPAILSPSHIRSIQCSGSTTIHRSSSLRSKRWLMFRIGEMWPSLKITRLSTLVLLLRESSRVLLMDLEAKPMPKTPTRGWTSTFPTRSGASTTATRSETSPPPTHTVMSHPTQSTSPLGRGFPCWEGGSPTGKWATTSKPTVCSSTPATASSSKTSNSNTQWRR